MSNQESQPDWFRENAPAYIAGGLLPAERERIEQFAESNESYRTELEQLMALDLSLRRAAGVESIIAGLEDRLLAALPGRRWAIHPVVRRAALATAACIVLGTFGYLGSQQMESNRLWGWAEATPGVAVQKAAPTVQVLVTNAMELTRTKKYREASGVINQILAIDPNNDYAVGAKPFIEDQANFAEQRADRELHDALTSQSNAAEESKIPYDQILRYPTDWPARSSRRDQATKSEQDGNDLRIHRADQSSSFAVNAKDLDGDGVVNAAGKLGLDVKDGYAYSNGTLVLNGPSVLTANGHAEFDHAIKNAIVPNHSIYATAATNAPAIPAGKGSGRLSGSLKQDVAAHYFDPRSAAKDPRNVAQSSSTYGMTTTAGVPLHINADEPNKSTLSDRKMTLKSALVSAGELGAVNVPEGGTILMGGQPLALAPESGSAPNAATTQPTAADGRKIIRTGTLEFEVDRFDSAAAVIGKIVVEQKGFVATTSSDKLANGKVRGSIVVRIPPEHLDAFVLQLRSLGDLKSQQIGSQDIGKEYTDLESELRADRAMEERLLDLIKNGKGEIKDLLAAEKELAEWRGKIEKIIGQVKYYDSQVALSTLTLSLLEKDIQTAAATVEQETISAGIESADVEKARAAALAILADAKARIVSADLKKLDAGQVASTIVADIPAGGSGPVVDRIKQLGKVARLEANTSTTTDPNNPATPSTRVEKRDSRLTLSIYNVANVAPRQSSSVNLAVPDVAGAYAAILAKVAKAGGRVVSGGSTQSQADAGRASAQIEVPTAAADGFVTDLRAMGDVVTLTATENTDTASVTSSKHGFSLNIFPATALPARQSADFRIEAADVEQASADVQAKLLQAGGRVIDSATHANPAGVSTATLSMDLPLAKSADAIAAVRGSGKVLAVNTGQDPAAPAGALAKCRVDVTFTTAGPITGETGGLLASLRHGLSLSARGLLYSAQLVVIGLCFVLPWAVVIYIAQKLWRRRKPAAG